MKNFIKNISLKKFALLSFGFGVFAGLISCGPSNEGWTVKGSVKDGGDKTMYIERQSGNSWLLLDSLTIDGDGSFAYTAEEPADGSYIYAIRLGDKRILFMPQSTEELTVTTTAGSFNIGHSVKGNHVSEGFARVDSIVNEAVSRAGAGKASNDPSLIKSLGNIIINDTTADLIYYVVSADINGKSIFMLDDLTKEKIRLLGAAANKFNDRFPNDPRTPELKNIYLTARNLTGLNRPNSVSMEANLSGRPNVEFSANDFNGVTHDLNTILDRGGVTVLNFTRFDNQASAGLNLALREAYNKYKGNGLEIVQIAFDPNKATWNQTAPGLPWIVLHGTLEDAARVLPLYMADPINGAPVTFIFNKDGEIVARVDNPASLDAELAKLF